MSQEHLHSPDGSKFIDIAKANEVLFDMTAQERIIWLYNQFPFDEIAFTTSGGKTSAVLPTIVSEALRSIGITKPFPVVFVDTLTYGKPTLDQVASLAERGKTDGYHVHTYSPLLTLEQLNDKHEQWYVEGSKDFEMARKVLKEEPLDRAFRVLKTRVWVSGIARYKSESRANAQYFGRGERSEYISYPLADWKEEMLMAYLEERGLPMNSKHRDIFRGGNQDRECGLHSF